MTNNIALFLHQPQCSIQSINGIITSLGNRFNFKIFTKHPVETGFFDDIDIVCFPGGIGHSDSWDYLLRDNLLAIEDFVKSGGKYLGICMGAYWAGSHYFNFLKDCDTKQYIKRPAADTRRPHAKSQKIQWQGIEQSMFFYDGCAIVGDGINDFNIVATYPNGDAMAVIQDNIGVIGCHPESQKFWYDSYSYMKSKWHNGYDNTLLLSFVDKLLK